MSATTISSSEAQARIVQVLAKNPFVSFATFGSDGFPDVRVLHMATQDGTDTIWFATETNSDKIAQLRNNPKAAIYGYDIETMTEFRLFGTVELLSDSAARKKIWQEEFHIQHFPDGIDSPNMIVLRFNTQRGVYNNYKEIGTF